MEKVTAKEAPIAYSTIGAALGTSPLHFVWAHGWGHDHSVFLTLASAFERFGTQTLLDLPGFGQSPPPPFDWSTADYADAIAEWISTLPRTPRVWIGHSFGCRVGLQLAARHPDTIDGLFLIAAAGLPRSRTIVERLKNRIIVSAFKTLGFLRKIGINTDPLREKFGSSDYRNAGAMRRVFVKAVQEDLSEIARRVRCPVYLVYGALDNETPPEIGMRLDALLPSATLSVLPRLDHYSILGAGMHQVQHLLEKFLNRIQR